LAFTVAELAEHLGARIEGDASRSLVDVRDLREAGPEHLAFVANPRYVRHLSESRAGAVLVATDARVEGERTLLRCADPYAAFARALTLFHPPKRPEPHVSSQASVHPDATLGEGVVIEPFAVVAAGARVGANSWLQSGSYVGAGAVLGADVRLFPGAVVMDDCVLGDRVWLNPGAVVGSEGFGFAPTAEGLVKIPQPAPAIVEDDVELGANTCVDRAALGGTTVRRGVKVDNLVQIGHAADVGDHSVLVALTCICGSTRLGKGVTMAVRSTALGHLEIGDGAVAAGHAMLAKDTPAGAKRAGVPAMDHRAWLRVARTLEELPELERELRRLRKRVDELEARLEE